MMWRSCKLKPGLLEILLIAAMLSTAPVSARQQAIELEGVSFPSRQLSEAGAFSLQGAGILKWGVWFDIYAAAYYAGETSPGNQRLVIHYFMPIEAQQIKTAAEKHLLKQYGMEYFASIKPLLDRLHAAMHDVDKGDSYAITLHQEQELVLELNGEVILRLPEPELGRTYLNLWLGDNPLDEGLKQRLLGTADRS